MSRPARSGMSPRRASGATTRSRPVSARSDCRIATNGNARRARAIGLSRTSNWRIVLDRRVMLADHVRERAVGFHEGVQGLEVPVDLHLRLLRQAARQCLRESLFCDLRQVDAQASGFGVQVRVEADANRPLPRAPVIQRLSHRYPLCNTPLQYAPALNTRQWAEKRRPIPARGGARRRWRRG